MILESIAVCLVIAYFLSWSTGVIEGFLFARFIKNAYPDIAEKYYPGMLKGSISQRLNTMSWLMRRKYADRGDSGLTERADLHRKITGGALSVMIITMIALVALGTSNRNLFSQKPPNPSAEPRPASQ